MKVSIEGFNQENAVKFKCRVVDKTGKTREIKLDCTDLVILRWLVDFSPNMKKVIINNKEYMWLSYDKMVKDLPLIDISKRAFSERLQKMVYFKILNFELIKENGTFTLYSFGKNYDKLIATSNSNANMGGCSSNSNGCSSSGGGCSSNSNGVVVQTATKDKTIIKYIEENNKDNKLSLLKENEENLQKIKELEAKIDRLENNKFVPPTLEEIKQYCVERNNDVDAQKFFDYYSEDGWKDAQGKPVKNWKKKMISNWEGKNGTKTKEEERSYHYEVINGYNTLVWDK